MRLLLGLALGAIFICTPSYAQSPASTTVSSKPVTSTRAIFRPIKDQITEAQVLLKQKGIFSGEATGKYSTEFRSAIKVFQGDNGLRKTGTLNRATLEAMKIPLTEYQKGIPIPPNSYAGASNTKSSGPRRIIFRATKDQIIAAQTLLRAKAMYTGEFTGKLNNETRAALRKFQAEAGIKVTGTLNRITLEAMGIPLTEKQAADKAAESSAPKR